jgi:hypothetical protein
MHHTRSAACLVQYMFPKENRHLATSSCMSLSIAGRGTLSSAKSVCHFSLLNEPRMPREKAIVSTFHPDNRASSLSRSGRYRSSLYASVSVCQSSTPSFGPVNSSMKTTSVPSGQPRRLAVSGVCSRRVLHHPQRGPSACRRCHGTYFAMQSWSQEGPQFLSGHLLHQLWTPDERTTRGWPSL